MEKIKVVSVSHKDIYEDTLNACYGLGYRLLFATTSYNPNGDHGKVEYTAILELSINKEEVIAKIEAETEQAELEEERSEIQARMILPPSAGQSAGVVYTSAGRTISKPVQETTQQPKGLAWDPTTVLLSEIGHTPPSEEEESCEN